MTSITSNNREESYIERNMNIGNLLTVFSILIAITSFAYNSNRKIILYKFTWRDLITAVIFLLLTNYLLLFDWIETNGWYFECFMHNSDSYLLPNQWAYVVTLIFLLYVLFRIFFCKVIPNRNKKGLLEYYEELIFNDISFLINCICRYHQKEIKKEIARLNHDDSNCNNHDYWAWDEPEKECAIAEPTTILQRIVLNRSFIQESIRHCYPLFFLEQVCELQTDRLAGIRDAVGCYYRTLIQEGNYALVDAINHTNNYLQDDECDNVAYRLYEYKFSSLTFDNIDFVCKLEVWRAFGEEGLLDSESSNFFHQKVSERNNDEYRKHPAKLCLNFYDILIRQIVYKHVKKKCNTEETPFIYPYYLYLICNAMAVDEEHYKGTYVEVFWDDLRLTLSSLLDVLANKNVSLFYVDLLRIIESLITISDYSEIRKRELLVWLLEFYIEKDSLEAIDDNFKKQLKAVLLKIKNQLPNQIANAWRQIDVAKYDKYPNYQTVAALIENNEN